MFPEIFSNSGEQAYKQRLKERNLLLLEEILGEDVEKKIEANERFFKGLIKPKSFQGSFSAELKMERDFEQTNNILQSHTTRDVANLTTKEYFGLVKFVQKKK